MGWLYRPLGRRRDAAATRPAPAPSPASSILGVKLIVESDVASLFGAARLLSPADLIDSFDQELAASGRCARVTDMCRHNVVVALRG